MIIRLIDKTYDLEKMHTKQLLAFYRSLGDYYVEYPYDHPLNDHLDSLKIIVKEELSKREHIPNRFEAKEIRKKKMIQRKNSSQKKYRNR